LWRDYYNAEIHVDTSIEPAVLLAVFLPMAASIMIEPQFAAKTVPALVDLDRAGLPGRVTGDAVIHAQGQTILGD
jgi:hypothetical protein